MRILSLTLVLLILFGCSKDEDTKTKASTSPLVATWQLDDLKIEGEIAGVKFSYDLDGLINQIGSNDEAPPKEQAKEKVLKPPRPTTPWEALWRLQKMESTITLLGLRHH